MAIRKRVEFKIKRGEIGSNYEITWWNESQGVEDAFTFVIPHDALEGDEGKMKSNITIDFDFTQHNTFVKNKTHNKDWILLAHMGQTKQSQ